MGRFDGVDAGAIKATTPQGVFLPLASAVYICLLEDTGTFRSATSPKDANKDRIVMNFTILKSPNKESLMEIPGTPAIQLADGTQIPAVAAVPAVEGSAIEGDKYTYLRKYEGAWEGSIDGVCKATALAFEGVPESELPEGGMTALLNEFWDYADVGSPLLHTEKGILFVCTTAPKLSKKGKYYTNHSFSATNAAQEQEALALLAKLNG